MQEDRMTAPLPESRPRGERQRRSGPCLDGFGTCVSIVDLAAAVVAAVVVRQNIDDHIYNTAAAAPAELTGAAIGAR
jgi:hypothetical protein